MTGRKRQYRGGRGKGKGDERSERRVDEWCAARESWMAEKEEEEEEKGRNDATFRSI